MVHFDIDRALEAERKRGQRRYGLSVVFGVPLPPELAHWVAGVRVTIERVVPGLVYWFSTDSLHATLIRGKSDEVPLPPIRRPLLSSFVSAIQSVAPWTMAPSGVLIYPDGYIRIGFHTTSFEPPGMDSHLNAMNETAHVAWRRTSEPYISLGCLIPPKAVTAVQNGKWDTLQLHLRSLELPPPILVTEVALVHFSCITFSPLHKQSILKLPLLGKVGKPNSIPALTNLGLRFEA